MTFIGRRLTGVMVAVAFLQTPVLANDNPSKWGNSAGGTGFTYGDEYGCLGITHGDYTEGILFEGTSISVLDQHGSLHVHAKGTYAWALYPYADDITGPYDTNHQQLYFGSTDIDFTYVIDNYTPGDTWSYAVPTLSVSGTSGTFVLPTGFTLNFSADHVGPADFGLSLGAPYCAN